MTTDDIKERGKRRLHEVGLAWAKPRGLDLHSKWGAEGEGLPLILTFVEPDDLRNVPTPRRYMRRVIGYLEVLRLGQWKEDNAEQLLRNLSEIRAAWSEAWRRVMAGEVVGDQGVPTQS
jgi:hypothetical protein